MEEEGNMDPDTDKTPERDQSDVVENSTATAKRGTKWLIEGDREDTIIVPNEDDKAESRIDVSSDVSSDESIEN